MTQERLAGRRHAEGPPIPDDARVSLVRLTTKDGATVPGALYALPGSTSVATLVHPRQDMTRHALVGHLLGLGLSVLVQGTRSVNNDLNLLHEQAVLDVAAGHVYLREHGFTSVITVGHSGGGALQAMYHAQSSISPSARIETTPGGKWVPLRDAEMPEPDGAVFIAPHPGQGRLLERVIDPSVVSEGDPMSVDPDLDCFAPRNGFNQPPDSSTFTDEFRARYWQAQRDRIQRIDSRALEMTQAARRAATRHRDHGLIEDRRRALAPQLITVYRTDADLRSVDLSIDPNERPYGSLFGKRPDLTNYGLLGFGRLATAEAWLSTWSANYSNAGFADNAPGVRAPTLLVGLTADQACFPGDLLRMAEALGARDLTTTTVAGRHFGLGVREGEPSGFELAARHLREWLPERFPTR